MVAKSAAFAVAAEFGQSTVDLTVEHGFVADQLHEVVFGRQRADQALARETQVAFLLNHVEVRAHLFHLLHLLEAHAWQAISEVFGFWRRRWTKDGDCAQRRELPGQGVNLVRFGGNKLLGRLGEKVGEAIHGVEEFLFTGKLKLQDGQIIVSRVGGFEGFTNRPGFEALGTVQSPVASGNALDEGLLDETMWL